jgi:O-antigen/teichoic acid export membrane protein
MYLIGGEAIQPESIGLKYLAFMLLFISPTLSLYYLNVLDKLRIRIFVELFGFIFLIATSFIFVPTGEVPMMAIIAVLSYGLSCLLATCFLLKEHLIDVKKIVFDLSKILISTSFSSLIFFWKAPLELINIVLFLILTALILTACKFWNETDKKILYYGLSFFKLGSSHEGTNV